MPRVVRPNPDRDGWGDRLRASLAAMAEFENPTKWVRNARGNLSRVWNGTRLTVFRSHGRFKWCVGEDEPWFSRSSYESEEDAKGSLMSELGVGSL